MTARFTAVWTRRWVPGILSHLENGPRRFNQVKRSLPGLGSKTLSENLKRLRTDGFVDREAFQTGGSLRVEYRLTEKGRDLVRVFQVARSWEERWGGPR
jgi:DNA-binding HxlR family transcriptional regulator